MHSVPTVAIHWFRQDLRLKDNPALVEAAKFDLVLPIYILDETVPTGQKLGAASKVWLHEALVALNSSLQGNLRLLRGDPLELILTLKDQMNLVAVCYNRCYEPAAIVRDTKLKKQLTKNNLQVISCNGSLLWEPWEVAKKDGSPYKVFTPFYKRGCLPAKEPRKPLAKPRLQFYPKLKGLPLEEFNLLPAKPWVEEMLQFWEISEQAAAKVLRKFLAAKIDDYAEGRNFPAAENVSKLSPYLHFGQISPNTVWHAAKACSIGNGLDSFLSELGWREFAYNLLYFNPKMLKQNIQTKFNKFPWRQSKKLLQVWQQGKTGYPIVDAGMRELWQTGYMHGRVRMIVASFLVKNLRLHWQYGERWFWDCLFDADLANNVASWQWVAGCGADAAPYFRIFNPVLQGHKFDSEGKYTKKYVPELGKLPVKYLFSPWEAPEEILISANVKLGKTYPKPVVDLVASRDAALAAYKEIAK